jgi:multiple sugar transport system substrate-binding protein
VARSRVSLRSRSPSRRLAALGVGLIAAPLLLAGCGGDGGATPTLTWYINPDNGGQAKLAQRCGDESNGAFQITTQVLPNDASQQREQLVRRLAAKDSSIDLMSLDPPFVAEFANAGFLRPYSEEDAQLLSEGVLEGPLETTYWNDEFVAAPFWANTQLLWYRKSVAQAAGVDPTSPGFTWQQMIQAAADQGKKIGAQGLRYEGYMVWVNALVASAGGQILTDVEAGQDAKPTLDTPEGDKAAEIIGSLARSPAAAADLSTAGEEQARTAFQADDGGFMLNWPYVWTAAKTAVEEGSLDQAVVDDIAWARYPRVDATTPSKPPLGGINLAIGNWTKYPEEAVAAVKCITSEKSSVEYMVGAGNPAAKAAAYDDPEVLKAYPMAPLIRDSINDAGPRPITPFYTDVSTSVQRTWHPPSSVRDPQTPERSDTFITEILKGERLL